MTTKATIGVLDDDSMAYDISISIADGSDGNGEDLEVKRYISHALARDIELLDVSITTHSAPTGAAVIFDVHRNGVTIFSTRPEIDIGQTSQDGNHVFSTTLLTAGDRLDFYCDQIGSTNAGNRVSITLKGKLR